MTDDLTRSPGAAPAGGPGSDGRGARRPGRDDADELARALGAGNPTDLPDAGTDGLFAPPAIRPVPATLAARIEAELADAAGDGHGAHAVGRRRPARWLAPLVAASLLAAVGGGLVVSHRAQHVVPAEPLPTTSEHPTGLSTSSPSTAPDAATRALAAQCQQDIDRDSGAGSPVGSVARGSDPVVLAHAGDRAQLCTTSDAESFTASDTSASSMVVRTLSTGDGRLVIAAAGRMLPGTSAVTIDGDAAAVSDGWWLWQRVVDAGALAHEPGVRAAWFEPPHSAGAAVDEVARYLAWPGRSTAVGLPSGRDAVKACGQMWPTTWSVLANDQHVVLGHVSGSGTMLCGGTTNISGAGLDLPFQASVSGPHEATNSYTTAAYGALPKDATTVTVSSALGTERASVGHGMWVWAHTAPQQDMGRLPATYTVHFVGSRQPDQVVDGMPLHADQVSSGIAFAAPWQDIDRHRAIPGTVLASTPSTGGHVLVSSLRRNGHAIVTVESSSQAVAKDATSPLTASTFALTTGAPASPSPSAGTGTSISALAEGGGALPAGVSAVVYHTSRGDVPAAVGDGLFAAEVYLPTGSRAEMPTSVTVSVNGQQRTFQL